MHLALIMDGNGRWAKQHSLPRTAGHIEGMKACKRVILSASSLGVDFLSLYVFSTENNKRPKQEVSYLMALIAKKLPGEINWYLENNIRIRVRGNIAILPQDVQKGINLVLEKTNKCNKITVVLCINYGGRDEIIRAVNRFMRENPNKAICEENLRNYTDCPDIPEPDLIARSAGEYRLSNFLLWDSAYSEFISIDKLWPDWGEQEIKYCLDSFSKRIRKFGGLEK